MRIEVTAGRREAQGVIPSVLNHNTVFVLFEHAIANR